VWTRRARGHRHRATLATATLAGLAVLLTATPAAATWVQQHATTWGKAARTVDGDTVYVDVWGDGTSATQSIRNSGIQAMEVGQCHAAQAGALMHSLTFGKAVRLSSRYASAVSLGRPVRFVDVETRSGYLDPQLALLKAGQAVPLVIPPETGRWVQYSTAAQQAALSGQNLWNPTFCGYGPQQALPIKLWVNYDGDGNEAQNPNAEYVRLLNQGTSTLHLGGWWVRTGAQDSYRFPAGTAVPAGTYITLYVGKGARTGQHFYWGASAPKFGNVDEGAYGNGAYLFDPQGDLRAHAIYPCFVSCTDVRKGNVRVAADPVREVITLTNTAATRSDLSFLVVSVGGSTYELPRTWLGPGASVRVHTGTGHNTSTDYYWGRSSHLLVDSGGRVFLRTAEDIRLGCDDWGNVSCPNPL